MVLPQSPGRAIYRGFLYYVRLNKIFKNYYREYQTTTGFTEWLTEDLNGDGNSDRLPSVYQSINTAAVGEDNNNIFATMADNNLIQEGEVFIDVTDPRNPQLRVFSKRDFYEN